MKVYAFVGESGSGKSYRAAWVAGENNIECIIDDGLLIRGNKILAGRSAKRETTKIASVRRAIFLNPAHAAEVKAALKRENPESVMILATSDEMADRIAKMLDIGPIGRIIRISDVASKEEIEKAKYVRKTQGKHVIPVPTFEIKKDFSGVLLDTLQIFNLGKRGRNEFRETKSVVRPNFSYRGDYHIADNVIVSICHIEAEKIDGTGKNMRCGVESKPCGVYINMDISVKYGYDVRAVAAAVRKAVYKAVYEYTAINVCKMDVNVRKIEV